MEQLGGMEIKPTNVLAMHQLANRRVDLYINPIIFFLLPRG